MCSETNNLNDNDKSSLTSKPSNPLLDDWSTQPFHLPPFHKIQPSHFKEAFEQGMAQHLIDLDEIVNSSEPPTFQNTIEAYDRAGALLDRISQVFSNMCSSLNTEELKLVQTEMVPILSRHSSSVTTYPGLFERISTVYHDSKSSKNDDTSSTTTATNSNNLTPEQHRLMERFYMDFTRSGAAFSPEEKKEYAEIKAQLASLQTQFSQNVMIDEESFEIVLTLEDMEGCPASLIEAAKQAAKERNKDEKDYVITLSRSLMEPFLTFSPRRDLREKAWREWTRRGELSSERANLPIALQILKLRKRQAEMHGCKTFAEYQCKDRMAKTPEHVMTLLENVWERAKVSANKEREALEAYCKDIGDTLEDGIQPWE
jgi:peptidyl-dipeptidase Dcp